MVWCDGSIYECFSVLYVVFWMVCTAILLFTGRPAVQHGHCECIYICCLLARVFVSNRPNMLFAFQNRKIKWHFVQLNKQPLLSTDYRGDRFVGEMSKNTIFGRTSHEYRQAVSSRKPGGELHSSVLLAYWQSCINIIAWKYDSVFFLLYAKLGKLQANPQNAIVIK